MDKHISKANYYNESLCNVLAPACKNEIKKLYTKVTMDPRNKLVVLRAFQEELSKIKDRSYEEFDEWFHFIMESKNMFWLPDLLVKVVNELCMVCGVSEEKVPVVDPVLVTKSCLINAARELWKQPYLLYDKFDRYEYCKNMSTFDSLVKSAVVKTIHDVIPTTFCEHMDDMRSELIDMESVMNEVVSDVDDFEHEEPIPEEDDEDMEDSVTVTSCCFSVASESDNNEEV